MLDTEDWKAIMKTQQVQQIQPVERYQAPPVYVVLTGVKTHAAVDPPSITVRTDDLQGWIHPVDLEYHAANPDRTETVEGCTRLRAFGEWFHVQEDPDEIVKLILQAQGVPIND